MKKSKQAKEQITPRTMLQIRVVRQDEKGTIRNVTHEDDRGGYGLRGLQMRSSCAYDSLLRTREFLGLLELAVENRDHVDAALVRRVLGDVVTELSRGGDLGCYVQYLQELFEGAMALPWINGTSPQCSTRAICHRGRRITRWLLCREPYNKPKGAHSMGMLYKCGKVFWIKYYSAGRPIRESMGTTKQKEAERFLKDREGRVAMGTPALPRIDRIRYDELADDLRRHYEVTNCRDLKEADVRLKPLKAFFSGRRASGIGGPDIERYVQVGQGAAVSNGAINRELSTLGRMLRLAYEYGKLQRVPMIHRLKEAAPRQGFFEREQFAAVRKQLPPDLQAAVTIAYPYGWRMQSEVLTLTLSQLDLEAGHFALSQEQQRMPRGG